jgi:membrane-associated protease RseP (regulator of RpoE activity)
MPSTPPDTAEPTEPGEPAEARPRWRTNAILFVATVVSVLVTGMVGDGQGLSRASLLHGAAFAGSLLAILVAHESGHYIAARIHKVDASLPYFIPMPLVSPFGTMGAVIRMRGIIPTRRALLDIGASGPLAGLVLAIPLYLWGFAHSKIIPVGDGGASLGESLLTKLLETASGRVVPPGMDMELSPVAFGAWAGLFVTMINLLPVGQLDGGHVAYALFGPKQDKLALIVHRSMLAFFFVSVVSFVVRDVRSGIGLHHLGGAVGNSLFWLVWFEVVAILGALSTRPRAGETLREAEPALPIRTRAIATAGLAVLASVGRENGSPFLWIAWFLGLGLLLAMEVRSGVLRPHPLLDHPRTGPDRLDAVRAVVAVITLAFFALLFMPTPIAL